MQLRPKKAVSILIVEDDKMASDISSRLIAMQFPSMTVYAAENGIEGIELFKRHAPEIVITDIGLPLLNGLEMAREIKSISPGTKFIVLTAYNEEAFMEGFTELGIEEYLLKPINLEQLMEAINKCVEGCGSAE